MKIQQQWAGVMVSTEDQTNTQQLGTPNEEVVERR